jgi:hypothetical protein
MQMKRHRASQHDASERKVCTVPSTAYTPLRAADITVHAVLVRPVCLYADTQLYNSCYATKQHQQTKQQPSPPAALQNSAPPGTICCSWLHTRLLLNWLVQGVMCPVDSSNAK